MASTVPVSLPVSLPAPVTGEVTFYLSLPSAGAGLMEAATAASTPGRSTYRHFSSVADAAARYGASDAQIDSAASSVETLGLQFAADPTRLFARVTGTMAQWQKALGAALSAQPATASSPFTTYGLPQWLPTALQPSGSGLITTQAQVYDPSADGQRPPGGHQPGDATAAGGGTPPAQSWPHNTGTPVRAGCSAPDLQQLEVYTEQQVQTA